MSTSEIQPSERLSPPSADVLASLLQQLENIEATSQRPIDTTEVQIFRFPLHVRERRAPDIRPRVVSIGPFFHGDPEFKNMEIKKLEFFKRLKDDTERLSELFKEVKSFVVEARKCYSMKLEIDLKSCSLSNHDFARMLLVDSCFIIGFLTSLSSEMEEGLVSLDWSIKEIRSDLLLLENQVPLFVLLKVYEFIRTSWSAYKYLPRFKQIVEPFITMNMTWGFTETPLDKANHLLHYYWLCFLPNIPPNECIIRIKHDPAETTSLTNSDIVGTSRPINPNIAETTNPMSPNTGETESPPIDSKTWSEYLNTDDPRNIPSATELYRVARVIFKKRSHNEKFVTEFRHGIMEMSSLKIDETRKIILTNLIGFEKSLKLPDRKVSSYMSLMDSLINTEEDVALLQKSGIFFNGLNSNSAAAEFFNEIGNMCTISYKYHRFAKLFKDVNGYYYSHWTRRCAILRHNYLSNTWAVISVAAAGFLLLLTILQTIFSGIQAL